VARVPRHEAGQTHCGGRGGARRRQQKCSSLHYDSFFWLAILAGNRNRFYEAIFLASYAFLWPCINLY